MITHSNSTQYICMYSFANNRCAALKTNLQNWLVIMSELQTDSQKSNFASSLWYGILVLQTELSKIAIGNEDDALCT